MRIIAAPLLILIVVLTACATDRHAEWLAPTSTPGAASDPCPIFRREFSLDSIPRSATARVIGLGHFELRINGHPADNTLINQAWSQYDKTIFWHEFDISRHLRVGRNAIAITLGNSFWKVSPANDSGRFIKTDAMPDFSNGYPHLLRFEADITTASDTVRIISDDSWRWSPGPLMYSNIYAGEDFDARKVQPGWDSPEFDDSRWSKPAIAPPPQAVLAPYTAPPIRAFEVFEPVEIREPRPGVFTYVFPQNNSSLLKFTVDGPSGSVVRMKPCEYMDAQGSIKFTYTWGTKKGIWHDYTLRGGGPETHQTVFCYVGAQYVQVTGAVPEGHANPHNFPVVKSLEMVHVRAACPEVGTFASSSDLQNAAHRLIDWSIRSNMSHVSTDCPHREKNGWQEQNWHMARSMSYRYDTSEWMAKACHDLRDTQLADGHVPTNCPNYLVGIEPHGYWNEAPEWGISSVLVPWHLYEWYGDRKTLAASFDSMRRYVAYLSSLAKDGLIKSNLGDWYDYGHGKGDGPSQWTPSEVSATAIWALGAKTVADAADVLGETAVAAEHRALFNQIRSDFQARLYDSSNATVKNNGSCQAGTAAALCIGLIPESDRARAVGAIVADLETRAFQQTTGEVLHVFLVRALADAGRNDVLHKVYAREDRGSYGFMVKSGLTTLPESWDARPGTGNSMSHLMLGHLVEWHFAVVAGIRQSPGSVGWKRITVAPNPGPLSNVAASFKSPAGPVSIVAAEQPAEVSIKPGASTRSGRWVATIEIPPYIESAEAILPDGTKTTLTTGRNTLRWTDPQRSNTPSSPPGANPGANP